MVPLIVRLVRSTRGATAVEYGLMLSIVVIALVSGFTSLGGSIRTQWGNMANRVAAVEP